MGTGGSKNRYSSINDLVKASKSKGTPNPVQALNKIRSKVRKVVGKEIVDVNTFFTWDYDTQQIVSNRKIDGWHFIFDLDGNEIESKRHKD